VVKAGDIVKVKVLEVDAARKRIALTMRLDDEIAAKADGGKTPKVDRKTSERYMGGGQPQTGDCYRFHGRLTAQSHGAKKTRVKKYFSSHLVALPHTLLV
jgi:transcriptional accessory protein Tex/SPT6